jgi:glycosyltransferase involved in cell wall biosynthesis
MRNVAFVNENTLGHTSYLPRFAKAFREHPEWGCTPFQIDAIPLPPELRHAERGIRGLHRLGLDGLITRWRRAASKHAAAQLNRLRQAHRIDAVIVNTQSVGLALPTEAPDVRCLVAMDATFEQLARSPWFGPTRIARWLQPITLAVLRAQERRLFRHASLLLPWSHRTADSLIRDYGETSDRIHVLPPSMSDPGRSSLSPSTGKPRLLFVGGDFRRKGGMELLSAWRSGLRTEMDLHVVTRDPVEPEPGLFVHPGVEAGSDAWFQLWRSADLFVFPSHLETFGIVLLEAMAFGVPILSARTGAADEILEHGRAGVLLDTTTPSAITAGVRELLQDREKRRLLSENGRRAFLERFEIRHTAHQLARLLTTD